MRHIIVVLVTCKNEEDALKNNGARVATTFFPIISLWDFFPDAQGQLTPQFEVEPSRDVKVVLVIPKN